MLGNPKNTFKINKEFGSINLNKQVLDYELIKQYILHVNILDLQLHRFVQTILIYIDIIDVNDNPPKFLNDHYTLTISEHLPIFSNVGFPLDAIDLDSGFNSEFRYKIKHNEINSTKMFLINKYTGQLRTNNISFSGIKLSVYRFTVLCIDMGQPKLTGSSMVTIKILTEEKEIQIKKKHRSIHVQINENLPIGSVIYEMKALNPYKKLNNNTRFTIICYSLDGNRASNLFDINAITGVISTKSSIDYEIDHNVQFYVNYNKYFILLNVTVKDMNDNFPEFNKPIFDFEVSYESPIGFVIGQVFASDYDDGLNGEIEYQWKSECSDFNLDKKTGEISLKRLISSKRSNTRITLISIAKDKGIPTLKSEAKVVIDIFDPVKFAVKLGLDTENLNAIQPMIINLLRETLSRIYPSNQIKLLQNNRFNSRNLLKTKNEAYYYGVVNETSNANKFSKTLIDASKLLFFWRKNNIGAPADLLINTNVTSVKGYIKPSLENDLWYKSDLGIVILILISILFVMLFCLLMGCLIIRIKKELRRGNNTNSKQNSSKNNESEKKYATNSAFNPDDPTTSGIQTAINPVYNDKQLYKPSNF